MNTQKIEIFSKSSNLLSNLETFENVFMHKKNNHESFVVFTFFINIIFVYFRDLVELYFVYIETHFLTHQVVTERLDMSTIVNISFVSCKAIVL